MVYALPDASNRSGAQAMLSRLLKFRTRHQQRDRAADVDRLQRIQDALSAVIDEMARESSGLAARLDKVTAEASLLYDDAEAIDRDRRLTDSERELLRAADRIRTLERRLGELRVIRESVERCFAERAPTAPQP